MIMIKFIPLVDTYVFRLYGLEIIYSFKYNDRII